MSDFVGVSDFSLRPSDFCLGWFTQIFVQIFASDFFGVSDFSLRFFKSFRFFSFQISDELQILEMAQIFSHSDFRRFRFSPDFLFDSDFFLQIFSPELRFHFQS